MRYALLVLLALLPVLHGCAALPGFPGSVSTHTSTFDGAKEISVEPSGVRGSGIANPFSLGAHWSTRAPDTVIVVVQIIGEYAVIESRAGLEFNAGGKILSLDSPQVVTDLDSRQGVGMSRLRTSEKRFPMRRADFARILMPGVGVKVNTARGYLEGTLRDEPYSALQALRKFNAALP